MTPLKAQTVDGYVRVSRKAGRKGPGYISPDVQREAIERWAEYKSVAIAEWHVDEDESGGTNERPGLDRARERCLAGETGGIVSWKIDRFSRNTAAGLRDLEALKAASARLAFVVEDIDTASPMGKFVYTIMLAVAEQFLGNITQSWAESQERAFERGAYIGPTPFGYLNVTDSDSPRVGCLDVDPEWGPVVREAFRRAASDGLHAAVSYLRDAAPDRRWRTDDARKVLRNRVYLGESKLGKRVKRDAHEPLTTLSDWTNAQTDPKHRRSNETYPLSQIARCANCGGPMTGSLQTVHGKTYRRMVCSRSNNGGHRCEAPASIRAEVIEGYVREHIAAALGDAAFRISYVPGGIEDARSALERAESELAAYLSDPTLSALGDAFTAGAKMRSHALDEARKAYATVAQQHERSEVLPAADQLDDPEQFGRALRAMVDRIEVRAGRAPVADRVEIKLVG